MMAIIFRLHAPHGKVWFTGRLRDRRGELLTVETILEPLTILDFDESSARVFGRFTAYLYAHGSPRGDMDILIASVVLVHGERLVTRNTRHFAGIPELVMETY